MTRSSHTASSTSPFASIGLAGVLAQAIVVPLRGREADHRHVVVVGPRSCCRRPGRSSSWRGRRWRRRAPARRTGRRRRHVAAGSAGATGGSRLAGRVLGQHRVPAELLAQRGDGAHGHALLVLAHEAGVERGADHRRGHAALDRLLHRPAPLAGVLRRRAPARRGRGAARGRARTGRAATSGPRSPAATPTARPWRRCRARSGRAARSPRRRPASGRTRCRCAPSS